MPNFGEIVESEKGIGTVTDTNIIAQKVKVHYKETSEYVWTKLSEIKIKST